MRWVKFYASNNAKPTVCALQSGVAYPHTMIHLLKFLLAAFLRSKMKTPIRFLLAICLILPLQGETPEELKARSIGQHDVPLFAESLPKLKESIAYIVSWQVIETDGHSFIVAQQRLPSFGESKENIFVWKKAKYDASMRHVWTLRTSGIGNIEATFDKASSMLNVHCRDNSSARGKLMGSFLLF